MQYQHVISEQMTRVGTFCQTEGVSSIEGANEKELIDEKQSKLTLWVFLFFVQSSPIAIINYICKK